MLLSVIAFALVRFHFFSAVAVFDEIDVRVLFLFSMKANPFRTWVKNPKIISHNEARGTLELVSLLLLIFIKTTHLIKRVVLCKN